MSINASLQNDSFDDKKKPKIGRSGTKQRAGYCDGSHSEIEVSHNERWGPGEIRARGQTLLEFMQRRWVIDLGDDADSLLFLPTDED